MRYIWVLFLMIVMASIGCNKKAGENLERDMADFETKWSELKNKGKIWYSELATEQADCRAAYKRGEDRLAKNGSAMMPDEKNECTLSLDSIRQDLQLLDSMFKDWKMLDSLWREDSVEWAFWKDDWGKGRLKIDVARKDLAGWNNKHKDYMEMLGERNAQFAAFKRLYHRHRRTLISLCGLTGNAL